ncbi:MAG: VTT domain-containing protein [Trueperaceae bacterium]
MTSDPAEGRSTNTDAAARRLRTTWRLLALSVWAVLLASFWLIVRASDGGPIETLLVGIDATSEQAWAPAGLLALYLLRPVLLLPITMLNLATGFFVGAWPGLVLALAGTLLSATAGYGVGRSLGSPGLPDRLAKRWRFVSMLRRRGFESVVAGGLMYLHADMVNFPSGLLRIPFVRFLAGVSLGNALTMTTAVLAGASVDGTLAEASLTVHTELLAVAGSLLVISLVLASVLRKRMRSVPPPTSASSSHGS